MDSLLASARSDRYHVAQLPRLHVQDQLGRRGAICHRKIIVCVKMEYSSMAEVGGGGGSKERTSEHSDVPN